MKNDIKNNILKKIKKGEIRLRSRLSIWIEKIGLGGSIALLFLTLIILSGLVYYWLYQNRDLFLAGYGNYGFSVFIQSFPFVFLVILLLLFALLSFLLRKYDISYKKPFILLLSFILGLVLIGGWFLMRSPLGNDFYRTRGRQFIQGRMRGENYLIGKVISVSDDQLILKTTDGKNNEIHFLETTHFPFGRPEAGDEARVVGENKVGYFEAYGIRVFSNEISVRRRGGGVKGLMDGRGPRWSK